MAARTCSVFSTRRMSLLQFSMSASMAVSFTCGARQDGAGLRVWNAAHLQTLLRSDAEHASPNLLLSGPVKRQLQAVVLQRAELGTPRVVADADDWNLGNLPAVSAAKRGEARRGAP